MTPRQEAITEMLPVVPFGLSAAELQRRDRQRSAEAARRLVEMYGARPHPLQCFRWAFWLCIGFWGGLALGVWTLHAWRSAPPPPPDHERAMATH